MLTGVDRTPGAKETPIPDMGSGIERWQHDNVVPGVIQFSLSGVGNFRIGQYDPALQKQAIYGVCMVIRHLTEDSVCIEISGRVIYGILPGRQ